MSISWYRYPVRLCLTVHKCRVCGEDIMRNQHYYDAKRHRAHVACAERDQAEMGTLVAAIAGPAR